MASYNDKKELVQTKRKISLSLVKGFEKKELTDEGLVASGYIATTHLDSGFYDDKGNFVRDKIAKETLTSWAEEINAGVPRANKMSINHDRDTHVAGVMKKGSAKVEQLPDGNYGLYVDTLVDKTKDNYEKTEYRILNDLLDSFSIEFITRDAVTDEYLPNAAFEEHTGGQGITRTLLPGAVLQGATYASRPMNENAVMIKEVIDFKEQKGDDATVEEKKVEEPLVEEKKEIQKNKDEDVTMTEQKEEEVKVPVEEKKDVVPEVSEEEKKEQEAYKAYKAEKAVEKKEAERTQLVSEIKAELKENLDKVEVENKVASNDQKPIESKEVVEFKQISEGKIGVDRQWMIAGKLANEFDLFNKPGKRAEEKSFSNFIVSNNKLEYKGLGMTTNQNADTDYLLSAAELSDVFDPIIYNHLNQKTTTWNVLPKDDYSSKGNNQVQFTIKTVRNPTAEAYTGDAVSLGNVSRLKMQTKFKKYQVGVSVSGDLIAAARGGPIGDVFAQEVRDSTDDLMEVMNAALYAEVCVETAAGVIGFAALANGDGNGTLYNSTRSAANQLLPDSATDTYINGDTLNPTRANLRKAIRNAIEEGASLQNLVFFCSPIQYDKIKAIYDDAQRLVPTSMRYGFEGLMEFDGIPVFYDKDCSDAHIFLVDTETHRIAIWVPPTLERLGKDSDAEKGFIKAYWCTYNRAPRRIVQIYGNLTT